MDNIPATVKKMLSDPELSMDQKMVGFMMFMPTLPDDPKVQKYVDTILKLGVKIKRLVDENKITIKMGKNFTLDVQVH
jgi:hypothetical protein|tara:strand:+ start:840 stop:1073 length:234 start_codon:yes stop_codon:yes gene_type:complete